MCYTLHNIVCLYWYCAPLSNTWLPGLAAAAAAPPGPAAAGLQGGSLRDPARPAPQGGPAPAPAPLQGAAPHHPGEEGGDGGGDHGLTGAR